MTPTNDIVQSDGNLRSFVWALYYYFVGNESEEIPSELWDGITCEVYNDGTLAGNDPDSCSFARNVKTVISFVLDENIKLSFQYYPQSNFWGGQGNGFNVNFIINGITVFSKNWDAWAINAGIAFATGNPGSDQAVSRKFRLSKYESDNVFILWIGSYSSGSFKDSEASLIKFKGSNLTEYWSGNSNKFCIEGTTVLNKMGSDSSIKSPMFSFEARTGYLDFISHSSFVSGSTKVFTAQR